MMMSSSSTLGSTLIAVVLCWLTMFAWRNGASAELGEDNTRGCAASGHVDLPRQQSPSTQPRPA